MLCSTGRSKKSSLSGLKLENEKPEVTEHSLFCLHGVGLSDIFPCASVMLQKLLPFENHGLWSPLPCAKLHLLSCVSIFYTLLWLGMEYMFVSPTCIISEFQNLSFCPWRRNCLMSLLVFFNIVLVFALIFVAVAISTYLCVFHCHFVCFVLLFQGHVACRNFNPTGPLFSISTSTFQFYLLNLNLQFHDSFHPQI